MLFCQTQMNYVIQYTDILQRVKALGQEAPHELEAGADGGTGTGTRLAGRSCSLMPPERRRRSVG